MAKDKNDKNQQESSREDFNQSSEIKPKDAIQEKSDQISEYDLQKKLDTYDKLSETPEQSMTLARLKQQHQQRKQQKTQNRSIQAVHYAQGKDAKLPHPDYEQIKKNYEIEDDKDRKDVLRESKEVYRAGETNTTAFQRVNKEPER